MPVLLWSTKGNVPEALWFRAITKKEGDTAFSTFSIPPLFCLLSPRKPTLLSCPNYTNLKHSGYISTFSSSLP